MDYIAKMTEQDLGFICKRISGKNLKKYYQNNPKGFSMIRPGFRASSLSEEDAERLAVRSASHRFISDFLCKRISTWMDEIQEAIAIQLKDGKNQSTALFLTLEHSVFWDNLELFFKLQETEYPKEAIELYTGIHDILSNGRDEHTEAASDDTTENVNIEKHVKTGNTESPEDWQEKEQAYQTKITELEGTIAACTEKLTDAEHKAKESAETLSKQGSRLIELERLAQLSVFEPELTHDAEYPYSSLCRVYEDREGHKRLHRLADIEDGVLLKEYTKDSPGTSTLYPKENFDNGVVGVWDWKAMPTESGGLYYESSYRSQFHVTEVVTVPGCKSVAQLIEELRHGIVCIPPEGRVLFSYKSSEDDWSGLYCEKIQLEICGQSIRIKNGVCTLRKYSFPDSAILMIDKGLYYRAFNLGMPEEIVRVNDPLDVVKTVLLQRINWTEMKLAGFHKTEYQEVRRYIDSLKTDDLYHEIASACECKDEEAEHLLEEFLQRANDYLNGDDFESGVLTQLVHNNANLMAECESAIYSEWQAAHKQELADAEYEKEEILQQVKVQTQLLADLQQKKDCIEQELDCIREEIDSQKKMAERVQANVDNRITKAAENASAFITNLLFQLPVAQLSAGSSHSTKKASYLPGAELDEDINARHDSYQSLLDTIEIELDEAGVGEAYRDALAAYLYSAYLHRMPIITAGPNGKDIADALSVSLWHRMASVLYLQGEYDQSVLENIASYDSKVIVVQNPFCSGWVEHLPSILEDRQHFYILNVPCTEELLIEPKSLYNYALPLLTEPLVTKRAAREYVGGICESGFIHYERKHNLPENRYNKFNVRLKMGPLLQKTYRQITADMSTFIEADSGKSIQCEILFELLPYAFATGNITGLESIFRDYQDIEAALPKELRQLLEIYWEETE